MKVSIHQPAYLPWLGYFHKIAVSDIFVILDNTQFEKNSFNNRNKIKTVNGPIWLTVPVQTTGKFKENLLAKVKIADNSIWNKKHWKSIELNYKKAPFFEEYYPELKILYEKEWAYLTDLCHEMLKIFVKMVGIETEIILSSNMKYSESVKTEQLINICKELDATTYISGILGKNYINEDEFNKENIKLIYQEYKHPTYNQLHNEFLPYMSVIDLIFNEGPRSLEIIMKDQQNIH
jgi:hypothetical protein